MRLTCDVLIPGDADPINDGELRISGGTIEYAGPAEGAGPSDEPAEHYPVLMPGMWDTHVHFTGQRVVEPAGMATTPALVGAIRATRDAAEALDFGFTSVREVGGYGLSLGRVIDEGVIRGPKIYAAGSILSPTGGHSDIPMYPLHWVRELGHTETQFQMCDGIAECLVAVRTQIRGGARVIKVCTSGGMMTIGDDPNHQQFSDEELKAIVDEAARADRVVAAHAHGKAGIMAALRAGARTIEHGSFLDDEAAEMMAEVGAILVPTRLTHHNYEKLAAENRLPDYAIKKRRENAARQANQIALAKKHGVTIAMGTDVAASGSDLPNYWGENAAELGLYVEAGLTPLEAIRTATANAPLTLGPQAPLAGILKAGYDADFIALAKNPLEDIWSLTERANILQVWKTGDAQKAESGQLLRVPA